MLLSGKYQKILRSNGIDIVKYPNGVLKIKAKNLYKIPSGSD
jgi:hypothetical protein